LHSARLTSEAASLFTTFVYKASCLEARTSESGCDDALPGDYNPDAKHAAKSHLVQDHESETGEGREG